MIRSATLASASAGLALAAVVLGAQAQSSGAPTPASPQPAATAAPSSLTWNGITLYGTVDVGYAHQTALPAFIRPPAYCCLARARALRMPRSHRS